jgi:predicted ABC-type ATPase
MDPRTQENRIPFPPLGGHTVPVETIHRRYHAGVRNFFELYSPIAFNWQFFDNTNKPRTLIAAGGENLQEEVLKQEIWDKLRKEYQHG